MSKSLEKVLLVDDDVANNFYNSVILKQHNPDIELESLLNGQELIKYVSDNGSENWPVTVFLDLNMHIVEHYMSSTICVVTPALCVLSALLLRSV